MVKIIDYKHTHCAVLIPDSCMLCGDSGTSGFQEWLEMAIERVFH
jgi:hypothetical protein